MPFILVYEETGVYISNIYVVIKVKNNFFKATYVELIFLLFFIPENSLYLFIKMLVIQGKTNVSY